MKNIENKINELVKEFADRHNFEAHLSKIVHPVVIHDEDEFDGEKYDWYTGADITVTVTKYKKKLNCKGHALESECFDSCKGMFGYEVYKLYCENIDCKDVHLPSIWFEYV